MTAPTSGPELSASMTDTHCFKRVTLPTGAQSDDDPPSCTLRANDGLTTRHLSWLVGVPEEKFGRPRRILRRIQPDGAPGTPLVLRPQPECISLRERWLRRNQTLARMTHRHFAIFRTRVKPHREYNSSGPVCR